MSTKTSLLDSAERAVRERGYDGFSYADLAEDVGIRKASIHHHYPTKAVLALALIQRYRENFFDAIAGIDKKHLKAGERLDAYIKLYRSALSGGNMLCMCIAFSIARDSLSDDVLAEINGFHKDALSWLALVFEAGASDNSIQDVGDSKLEAAACLALVEGGQLIGRSAKKVSHFDRAVELLKIRIT